jgi:hypothetical protein
LLQRWKLTSAVTLVAALLVLPSEARADDPKKAPQDYGGPPSETTAGDVLIWPARVIFFPLWVVSEFVFRRPLGGLTRAAEKGRWIEGFTELFTFGERKQFTILPSALLDFGLKPSVGFNASYRYLGDDKNTAKLHFGTWGPDWIAIKATDTYDLSKNQQLFVETSLVRRRDNPFSGIGPRSKQDDRMRYASTVAEANVGQSWTFWRESVFRSRAGLRSLAFHDGGCCGDETLSDAIAAGRTVAPGFGRGYTGPFQRLELELDSRTPRPDSGGGLRLEAHEETVFPLDAPRGEQRRSWVRYGGSVGGAFDMTGSSRVVSLSVAAELADPLSSGPIPFTDQVSLGGDVLMPGYLRGRLVDRSATVATLQYRWPIWVYLDGVIHAAVGNVWGQHFAGFDAKASRLSSGVGIRSNGDRASGFEALFAVGTDPFDEGFNVSSLRLLIGSHHGF